MRKTGDAAAHFGMELAGYTKRIQMSDTKGEALEAVPILGAGIEQPVFLSEEMQAQEQAMLGFKMASYNRENHGTLYVELVQKNVSQSFECGCSLNQGCFRWASSRLGSMHPKAQGKIVWQSMWQAMQRDTSRFL